MARTPHTSPDADSTQAKVWIRNDLLEWLDAEAESQDRSRAWLINAALEARKKRLESRRKKTDKS